jgi:hypothetical protein
MAEGLILAGNVYMAPIASDGTRGKLRMVGNTTKLAIKPNSTKKEQKSKMRGSYGTAITTVMLPDPSDFSMTLQRIDKTNLMYQFMGSEATYTQTAGTVTDEAITAVLDGWIKLAKEKVSSVVVTNSAASTTYVPGTDYELNADMGMIRAIPGGAITEGLALKVDYSAAAISDGWAINGSTQNSIRVYVLLDGENIASGELITGEFWDVMLTPDQELDFLSDELVEIGLSGAMQKPAEKPSAYTIRGRSA